MQTRIWLVGIYNSQLRAKGKFFHDHPIILKKWSGRKFCFCFPPKKAKQNKTKPLSYLKNSRPEHKRSFRGKLWSCHLKAALTIIKIRAFNEGKAHLSDQILT